MYDSIYDIMIYFMLYSFTGWVLEVIYAFYKKRKFVNRGFLSGPICPIYGFGALLILQTSSIFKFVSSNPSINLILIIIFTTLLEYMTGYVLETFLNVKAWDYSKEFCNFKGRICLKFSILWGLIGCFLVYILHPMIVQYVNVINEDMKMTASLMFMGCVLIDTLNAAVPRIDFMKQLKSRIRDNLHVHIFKL